MSEPIIYVSRLLRLPLVSDDGADVGHVVDVVLDPVSHPPRVSGFVIGGVQRRHVFVPIGRIEEIDTRGLRLRRGIINLRRFVLREGERLAARELLGRRLRGRRVVDIGLRQEADTVDWVVATVALAAGRVPGLGRTPTLLDWSEAGELFAEERPLDRQAASFGALHPAEMASAIRRLPLDRRRLLAAALDDDRLAALLEELPEDEQLRLIEGLDPPRLGRVLDAMDADDAADLLGELPADERARLLAEMDPGVAAPVRRLLTYEPDTAGGLMTPDPIVLAPGATVAEALARMRQPDVPAPLAAQVFVCQPPLDTPTGRFVGAAGFQRLLREAASKPVGRCLDEGCEPLAPGISEREVGERLAAYDIVAIPVVDESGRLLGAVTVDDVVDRLLPVDWRATRAS